MHRRRPALRWLAAILLAISAVTPALADVKGRAYGCEPAQRGAATMHDDLRVERQGGSRAVHLWFSRLGTPHRERDQAHARLSEASLLATSVEEDNGILQTSSGHNKRNPLNHREIDTATVRFDDPDLPTFTRCKPQYSPACDGSSASPPASERMQGNQYPPASPDQQADSPHLKGAGPVLKIRRPGDLPGAPRTAGILSLNSSAGYGEITLPDGPPGRAGAAASVTRPASSARLMRARVSSR